jgi:uroporphyrinogen decarboxylase
MMSPQVFHDLIFPYYQRFGQTLRECNMHWWLHSCGNNTSLMEDLIAAGVDVFHPVQKGTMDYAETVKQFGGRISFLAGVDVQHALQEMSPEEVRAEVRSMIDAFDLPEGGMCIAAGNGIVAGTPLENIEAFLDEALRYGTEHRQQGAPA